MEKVLSIIIPAYNAENELQQCVESLLKTSKKNFEIIIVNDGSKDTTHEICKNLSLEYGNIIYIEQKNKGVSAARNKGLQHVKGKYVNFIDADDYVDVNYIDHIITDIEKNQENDLFIYGLRKRNINNGYCENIFSKEVGIFPVEYMYSNLYKFLRNTLILFPVNKVYKFDIIKMNSLIFNEKLSIQEDLLFNINYLKYTKLIKISSYVGYNYIFKNNNTLSTNFKEYYFENRVYVFNSMYNTVKKSTLFKNTIKDLEKYFIEHVLAFTILQLSDSSYSRLQKYKILQEILNHPMTKRYLIKAPHLNIKKLSKIVLWLAQKKFIFGIYLLQKLRKSRKKI